MIPAPAKVRVTTVRPLTRLTDGFNGMAGPPASGVRMNAPATVTTSSNVTPMDVTIDRCAAPPFTAADCTVANGGRLVSPKTAGVVTPGALAVTMKLPVAPAMKAGAWAAPALSVRAIAMLGIALRNVPVGPVVGAVKVTITPGTGFPYSSRTTTDSGVANAVPGRACCGGPAVAVTVLAAAGATRTAAMPPIEQPTTSATATVQAPAVANSTLKLCVPLSTAVKV